MKELLLSSALGLALGIGAQRMGLHRRASLRRAIGLMDPSLLRRLLLWLGGGILLTSLLMWLAVIDVDTVAVPALDGGTLLGGAVFGAALGYAGAAPATAGSMLGADRLLEGLCALAGCAAAWLLLPYAEKVFAPLRTWLDGIAATWFQVTLDKPFLLAGGFLGQACLGALTLAAALCIRRPKQPAAEPEPIPVEAASAEPEAVQEEAVVVSLPGEEVVVVDTTEDPADE